MTARNDGAPTGHRRLALWLFLASLSVLFGGSLVAFAIIRLRSPEWPPAGSPGLPPVFWVSTALLVVVSSLLVAADGCARSGRRCRLTLLLAAATATGAAFVASQAAGWLALVAADEMPQQNLFLFGLYVLSFLHALHVAGGLVPLVVVTARSRGSRYTSDDHEGVTGVGLYWHFLGVVWIAILAVLLIRL